MSLRDKYTNDEWTELESRIQSKSQKKMIMKEFLSEKMVMDIVM